MLKKGSSMNREEMLKKHQNMLCYLNQLPKKMLSLHGADNITDFVMHDLCNKQCFNLKKAAYFVDNPDFNCLKGVAGFYDQESFQKPSYWESPDLFTNHVKNSQFNQKVRSIMQPSMKKTGASDEKIIDLLSHELNLQSPQYCAWDMKHDNHGIFIYELASDMCEIPQDLLTNGVCLLSFCPIY